VVKEEVEEQEEKVVVEEANVHRYTMSPTEMFPSTLAVRPLILAPTRTPGTGCSRMRGSGRLNVAPI
jgi:hypothetical protein